MKNNKDKVMGVLKSIASVPGKVGRKVDGYIDKGNNKVIDIGVKMLKEKQMKAMQSKVK